MNSKPKASSRITLVLIGATAVASLVGCGKDETRRDVYANKQDCLADWGNDPKDCEEAKNHPRSTGGNMAYFGRPYPYKSGSLSPLRSGKAIGSTSSSVSRGGFGSSGLSASG